MNSSRPFVKTLIGLIASLPRYRRIQLLLLVGLMLLGALAEVISIGAIVPFLAFLVDPAQAFQKPLIAQAAGMLGLTDVQDIRLHLTLIFAITVIMSGVIRLALLYAVATFNFGVAHTLSSEIYRRTLYQPYAVHVARNSSDVIGGISKVDSVAGVLYQLLIACSSGIMAIFIVGVLVLVDPLIAMTSMLGFGSIYVFVSLLTRKRLATNSRVNNSAFNARIQAVQEGLGGIRDVLLDHAQPLFTRRFDDIDKAFRQSQASTYFIGPSPRFAVEAVGMALIALLSFHLTRASGGIGSAIPILGALALGAQRLMPLVQQIYQGWVIVAGNRQVLADVLELVDQPLPPATKGKVVPLPFERDICLDEVSFRYQPHLPAVLRQVNLKIPKGARVGLIGATGSGKSTVMDLVMGLLQPSTGQILVDGRRLTGGDQLAWQRNIAHVPQSIFLADASFAENIAFGVPLDEIDFERVEHAARKAQIADYIATQLDGYSAMVGERGVRLSGGQRQRVGIARAFYKQASVLVFDEATSALDSETENSVMQGLYSLERDLTVLVIAHRLTTLSDCDVIYRLNQGRIESELTFEELLPTANMLVKDRHVPPNKDKLP